MPEVGRHANQQCDYSIVVPVFNAEATIGRAVESVLAQSIPTWELVVVNDGSTDGTAAVLAGYEARDARIRVIHQENLGPAAARNAGISLTCSPFVVFLDADDELLPRYLEMMDSFVAARAGYDIYHPNLVIRRKFDTLFSPNKSVTSTSFDELLRSCVIAAGGAMVSRGLVERLGGFRTDLHCEDYDFWLRALAGGARALYLPEPLYVYHQGSYGRRSQEYVTGVTDLERSLRDLIDSGAVSDEDVESVARAADRANRAQVTAREHAEMHEQAEWLYSTIKRRLGVRATEVAMRMIHSVSWAVRPVRRLIARVRVGRS